MSISNKYNIPQDTVNQMVKDGIISSKWPRYEEVYALYKQSIGKSKASKFLDISIKLNIPERTVKMMIETMDKI